MSAFLKGVRQQQHQDSRITATAAETEPRNGHDHFCDVGKAVHRT